MTRGMYGRLLFGAWLGVGLALGASRPATAGLMGSTVNVSAYYPTTTNVYVNAGNETVTTGVEYPPGSFSGYNAGLQVNVTDDQFILSAPRSGLTFAGADFNGFILKVISGPTILSATVDGSSEFSPVSITVLNGNEVQLNYSGVTTPGSDNAYQSVINFTFAPGAVPEPSSLISGGVACALGLVRVRRRRAKAGA